ncbi:peptidoglycan recognition family protein [Streptomyces sp. NBC_00829]|uniref:peptidoglycan recognition protein family protein n=1 Tax=Streptomyces sp. NBC_00829 TaxID=2903679 RepID=UPI00386AA085|nr:peptidoglycan recognition protein family protein [Streptomyces sp. NBC_00829]
MKLVTRAQLGWPASAAPTQTTTMGVKVHYEGAPVSRTLLTDHAACIAEWKNIRASHLANTVENYSDVAYNYAACPHGFLLEGRGLRKRTGANGNQTLNQAHYAIVGLVGSSGLTDPTDAMLGSIRDGIDLLRANGAGPEVKGHRDGYATACPGGPLYAWVQRGAPRPTDTPAPSEEDDMTPEQAAQLKALYEQRAVAPWTYKGTRFPDRDAFNFLVTTDQNASKALAGLVTLAAKVDALPSAPELTPAQLEALVAQVSTSPTLAERIAELTAAKLAARLAQ